MSREENKMKKIKTAKKSMRVLIAVLISLLCVNGAMMALTVIANAETVESTATAAPAAKASLVLSDSIARNQAAVAAALVKSETAKASVSAAPTAKSTAPTTTKTTTTKTTATTTTTKTTSTTTTPPPSTTTQPTTPTTPTPPTTSTSTSLSTVRSSVNASLLSAFDELEFKIVVNPDAAYLGYFSTSKHSIEMRVVSVGTFRHEMGHFLDVLRNMPSRSAEFTSIYTAEKSLYSGTNATYVTKNAQEYFAQSYRNYLESASKLKAERPRTYEFIRMQVESICASDVTRTYNYYSWAW